MHDVLFKRASVRKFTADAVTDEQVRTLLRAGMAAPSGGNQQPWEFFVVRDAEMRDKLSVTNPYAKPAASAPCVIVPCARTEGLRFPELAVQDMSAAVENMWLATTDIGLGAVWMGIAPDAELMAAVAATVGISEGLEPFALFACGVPEKEPTPKGADRYDESRVHWVQ